MALKFRRNQPEFFVPTLFSITLMAFSLGILSTKSFFVTVFSLWRLRRHSTALTTKEIKNLQLVNASEGIRELEKQKLDLRICIEKIKEAYAYFESWETNYPQKVGDGLKNRLAGGIIDELGYLQLKLEVQHYQVREGLTQIKRAQELQTRPPNRLPPEIRMTMN